MELNAEITAKLLFIYWIGWGRTHDLSLIRRLFYWLKQSAVITLLGADWGAIQPYSRPDWYRPLKLQRTASATRILDLYLNPILYAPITFCVFVNSIIFQVNFSSKSHLQSRDCNSLNIIRTRMISRKMGETWDLSEWASRIRSCIHKSTNQYTKFRCGSL